MASGTSDCPNASSSTVLFFSFFGAQFAVERRREATGSHSASEKTISRAGPCDITLEVNFLGRQKLQDHILVFDKETFVQVLGGRCRAHVAIELP
jgi:hypothetical protein